MKKNRFTDCPVCGASDSMHLKTDFSEKVHVTGYKPFTIHGLEGFQCKRCKEIILTAAANKHFDSSMAEDMAREDSQRTVAADLVEVDEVASRLAISRQRVHQMMKEGKIRYVFVGKIRYPLRSSVQSLSGKKKTK